MPDMATLLQRENLLRLERGLGTFVADGVQAQVSERDFRAIEELAEQMVQKSREAGLRKGELTRLIQSLWKEGDTDVSG